MITIRYSEETCAKFDQATRRVLDALNKQFSIVELQDYGEEWFVRLWKTKNDEFPVGIFGKTPYDAAERLARQFPQIDLAKSLR